MCVQTRSPGKSAVSFQSLSTGPGKADMENLVGVCEAETRSTAVQGQTEILTSAQQEGQLPSTSIFMLKLRLGLDTAPLHQ